MHVPCALGARHAVDKKAEPRKGEVRAGYYGIGARSSRPVFIITIAAAANVIMMHPCQLMVLYIHTNNI